ncbi:cyclic nucleotide-binding domain-containing protein [[Clostridium] polysaccharolyticum]|nr:cyclic nucleotide-binding domain-containing protein [[Clostridium] polysaccharolyticum]
MEALNKNAMNQVPEGTIIFKEGDIANYVGLVLRGRVQIESRGSKVTAGAGTFIGVADFAIGRYQSTYYAVDNVIIYIFEIASFEDLKKAVSANRDYGGLMIASQSRYIRELERIRADLMDQAKKLEAFLKDTYKELVTFSVRSGYPTQDISMIQDLTPNETVLGEKQEAVDYFCASSELSIDLCKTFYSDSRISVYTAKQQVEVINLLIEECTQTACYIVEELSCLYSEEDSCLLKQVVRLIKDISADKNNKEFTSNLFDRCVEVINKTESMLSQNTGYDIILDREYLEDAYYSIMSGDFSEAAQETSEEAVIDENTVMFEVKDALNKILHYSRETEEEAREFKQLLMEFARLDDKLSSDDSARKIRRRISEAYYQLYEKVFLVAYEKQDNNLVIDLFLNFGFVDENLLTKEQIMDLCRLRFDMENAAPCRIYSMKDWLTCIYEQKKDPSKSEFDLDYYDNLRERKRMEKLTEREITELSQNKELKLEYEIKNMLKYNTRIASGRISTYVPFLHQEVFYGRVQKAFHTAKQINAAVNRLLSVDYSIFYRERVYSDLENGITKEYIMEQVFPDIILLPVCGSRAIMWQEITGRKRNTPGRFLIPALTEENLEEMLVELFGRFRWELCRTIQGTAWNNIQYPSLTSEYVDYIQFYQKNRDLTAEKKEKLKAQIARGRGNNREVFLIDYIAWVTRECRGEIRLNKVARGLLATYVPFLKDVREKVIAQPIFAEAYNKFERHRTHKVREMEMRIRALEKDKIEVPEEVMNTLEFYKDK